MKPASGTAPARQQSAARQEILTLLEGREAMTPAEIAKELEKTPGAIKTILARMVQDGLVEKTSRGHYRLASSQQ